MQRYVFSEFTSFARLTSEETLRVLADNDLLVYVAIGPKQRADAAAVIKSCQRAGVRVGLWPLLDDHDGRWASAWNGIKFAAYCRALVAELDAAGVRPDEVIVDLEPPIGMTKRALRGRVGGAPPPSQQGTAALVELVSELSARCPVTAAVAPWAASGGGRRGWQRLMGTPIDALPFERVFLMAYTSLLEGYSRGVLGRLHAEALLAHWSEQAKKQFGQRSAVAVGVVGVGALGDERTYRHPSELSRDVGICLSAGVGHVALFNLGGVLSRSESPWLEALSNAEPVAAPRPSNRVRLILAALGGAGRFAGVVPPLR